MSRVILLSVVIAAAISVLPRDAGAQRYYPWCAWYDEWTYNCGFTTLQQCRETISGVGGICKPNPNAPPDSPRPRRRY